MFVEVGLERKGLGAALALVVLEGRVGLHVCAEVGPVREALAAMCAAEWLVAGVAAHMALQQPRTGERLQRIIFRSSLDIFFKDCMNHAKYHIPY